jgi:hypothetical protein
MNKLVTFLAFLALAAMILALSHGALKMPPSSSDVMLQQKS